MTDGPAAIVRIATLVELGRWADGRQAATTVLAGDPDNVDALAYLAVCLLELRLSTEALDAANRMVVLAPEDNRGHRLCALALNRIGQHREAMRAAAEAIRHSPHDWYNHMVYASAALETRGKLWEAKRAAYRTLELAPGEPDAHFIVGLVAHRRDEVAEARAAYERTLQLAPDHTGAINNLALLDGLHRTVRASRGFAAALRSDPHDPQLRENLDAVLTIFVLILYFLGGAGVVIALAVVMSDGSGVARGLVAAGFTLALVAYAGGVMSRMPRAVRRYALTRLRHSGVALWCCALAVLQLVGVYVICFSRHGEAIGLVALRPVALTMVVTGMTAFVRRRHG